MTTCVLLFYSMKLLDIPESKCCIIQFLISIILLSEPLIYLKIFVNESYFSENKFNLFNGII
ncbi:MAG: hypothetical protein DWQ10_08345 [Calditrichaeota bacterium]|nr:MAG: hypothetical protein DWQ10_08345 [Calditrichota bacterium]